MTLALVFELAVDFVVSVGANLGAGEAQKDTYEAKDEGRRDLHFGTDEYT